MKLRLLSTGFVIFLAQSLYAQITVNRVRFRACTDAHNCSEVTRWRTDQSGSALTVLCNIRNVGEDFDHYFVVTSTDYVVAPRTVYSAKDFGRLRTEISWGRIVTQNDDMSAVVVRDLRRGLSRELVIEAFSPKSLIEKFPGDSDNLWPWLARVNIFVVDQKGRVVGSGNAILEIEPVVREAR